jgi:hypothetical protein
MSWKKILQEGDAAVLSDTVPNTIEPDDSASAGVATDASRQDHEHAIVTGTPTGDVAESASAAEGSGTSFVRVDHVHNAPATWAPTAHEASHKSGGGDEILLNEFGDPTGNVEFNQQELLKVVVEQLASAPGTPTQGQIYYDTVEDHIYVYVAS